jgi:hypothetical protein
MGFFIGEDAGSGCHKALSLGHKRNPMTPPGWRWRFRRQKKPRQQLVWLQRERMRRAAMAQWKERGHE